VLEVGQVEVDLIGGRTMSPCDPSRGPKERYGSKEGLGVVLCGSAHPAPYNQPESD
jgi:hypothetical protein